MKDTVKNAGRAPRVAVWNTAFLGDAVLTLPLLQSLRARFPSACLDFYVRGGLEALFSAHPAIDHVHAVDKKRLGPAALPAFGRILRSRRYDLWISAHASIRSSAVALLSGAPVRIGYAQAAFARIAHTRRVDRKFAGRPEIERLLALLEPLDAPLSDASGGLVLGPSSGRNSRETWPEIVLPPEAENAAGTFFASLPPGRPVLGLHPGSVWPTKRWPAAYFADIGRRALDMGAVTLIFGGPGEEELARRVWEEMAPESATGRDNGKPRDAADATDTTGGALVRNLAGKLSLPELAAYLARLSCYVTNDSGPMHIAWARRVPVTALFGPTVRAHGFFPRGEGATVFERPLDCRPCGLHGSARCPRGDHACMAELTPDMIWRDVAGKLRPKRSSAEAAC